MAIYSNVGQGIPYNQTGANPYGYGNTYTGIPSYPPNISYSQSPSNVNVIWISDEDEAKRYPIGPNSAVVLWDAKNNKIYLKKADATGNPSTKTYSLIEDAQVEEPSPTYVTEESFNNISKIVTELTEEIKSMKKDIYGVVGKKGSK